MTLFADQTTDETRERIKEASSDPMWGSFVETMLKEGWDTAVRRAQATDKEAMERVNQYHQSPFARGFYAFVKEAYDHRDEVEEMAKYASQQEPEHDLHAGFVAAAQATLSEPIEKVAVAGPPDKEAFLTPGDYGDLTKNAGSLSDVFSQGKSLISEDNAHSGAAKSIINNPSTFGDDSSSSGKSSLSDVFSGGSKADYGKKMTQGLKNFTGPSGGKVDNSKPSLTDSLKGVGKKIKDTFGSNKSYEHV